MKPLINPSCNFGCMLLVGAIHFEDRFCACRKGGTGELMSQCHLAGDSTWRLLQLAVEKPWLHRAGSLLHKQV